MLKMWLGTTQDGLTMQSLDPGLLALALLSGALACFSAMTLLSRAAASGGRARLGWLVGSAGVFGSGVWTTHFVAMVACGSSMTMGYAIEETVLSLVIAILGVLPAFALALEPNSCWRRRALSGMILAGAVAAMHFTGMAALTFPGTIAYDAWLVIGAIGLCNIFSIFAFTRIGTIDRLRGRSEVSILLVLSIASAHFIAMAGTRFVPGADQMVGHLLLGRSTTLAAAAASITAITISLAVAWADQHWRRLNQETLRLRELADSTIEGLLIHREGQVIWANATLQQVVGSLEAIVAGGDVAAIATADTRTILQHHLNEPSPIVDIIEIDRPDGTTRTVEILSRSITYGGQVAGVVAMRDITERRRAEDRISHLAHHDPLTGLANRVLFNDRLAGVTIDALRSEDGVALVTIDLDRFKSVNDLHGHLTGDRLLQQVAARLTRNVREADTVARLGGDEFAIICPVGGEPLSVAGLAQRIVEVLGSPFQIDGQMVSIGASVGIALCPQDAGDPETLYQASDLALNRAKRDGRSRFCFFEPGMDIKFRERRSLEQDLRQALAREELTIDYQPLVDCKTLEATGFEALVRWHHWTRGFISPAEFIPLAEETSLILPLGRFVLTAACNEAASWPQPYRVAVNLSPAQFHMTSLAEEIAEIVAQSGLAPERLELEVTEGVLIGDTDRALKVLSKLKALGIRIALDDFGTGYSSLSYLRRFPFDKIKIDRSFVQSLGNDSEAGAIVRAILAMGRSLHLDVTAEGVENTAQLETLRAEGCDLVQGFLLGRPSKKPLAAAQHLQNMAADQKTH